MTSKKVMNSELLEATDDVAYSDQMLPKGWQHVSVGEILTLKRGYDLPKQDRKDGIFPIFAANGIVGTHSKFMARAPGVVTGRSGTIGKVHIIEENFWPLNTALYVKDFHGNDPKFIAWLLRNLDLSQFNSSTAVPSLNRNIVHKHTTSIPPRAEQTRIVSKIESLQTRSAKTRALLTEVKPLIAQLRQSVLRSAFNGSLTADWRAKQQEADTNGSTQSDGAKHETASELIQRIRVERRERWEAAQLAAFEAKGKEPSKGWKEKYKEPNNANSDDLPDLPESWIWATIGDLAEVGTGTTPRRNREDYWANGTIPWIASSAVNNPYVNDASELITENALRDSRLKLYPAGTLLIALYGEGKTRGMTTELKLNATINQALAAIQFGGIASQIKDFVKQSMISAYERMRKESMGGVQPNLNLEKVRRINIPLAPLIEQQVILESMVKQLRLISMVEAKVALMENSLALLDQSILSKAFRGELVPQDPSDEPVSELLARIHASREATAAKKKPSKKKAASKKKSKTKSNGA